MGALVFSVTNKNKIMNKEKGFTWKLGMFVIIGLLLFVSTIYYVGKQNNLFGDTFHLKTTFKNVSGLKEGNNVRFSGINVGTVNEIVNGEISGQYTFMSQGYLLYEVTYKSLKSKKITQFNKTTLENKDINCL